MSPFEYVTVLISIILGLGITQILIGLSELIRRWQRVVLFWPMVIWIALVFVMNIHEWWVTYQLKSFDAWRLHVFLFVALYPINLFVMSNLLFPQNWPKKSFNMEKYYYKNWRKLFSLALVLPVVSFLENITVFNYPVREEFPQFIVVLALAIMLIAQPRQRLVHLGFALLLLSGFVADLIVQSNMLLISN